MVVLTATVAVLTPSVRVSANAGVTLDRPAWVS